MPLDLADYETKAKEAIKAFWGNRAAAVAKQKELGHEDQGERAGVTAGKNMDGFIALIQELTVRQPHMASAAVIGETDNGLNPLRGLAKAHASRQV